MNARIYLRASTKDQDSHRAEQALRDFAAQSGMTVAGMYAENISGTKLDRPELMRLLTEAEPSDILLCESVDRLSRLSQNEWKQLRAKIDEKGLRLVVADLPTTHQLASNDDITSQVLRVINDMLLDLMATMARLDQQKRVERIKQGLERRRERGEAVQARGKSKAWDVVKELLLKHPDMSVEHVAGAAKCGVATVYRVKASTQ